MKFESKYFEQYGDNAIVENIPEKHLTEMLVELTSLAIFNINPTIPGDETIKRAISLIIELVRTTYRNYPLLYVKRAFINGSLGVLGGTSVFSVRNINIWLASQREFVDAFYLREERDKRFRELAREEEEWR
ncbi:MAG: hypothetical protein GX459_12845, partial [Bacteroidales bacterium]|nr:hypothetical protein [Bacteroidales bacterium]